MSASSDKESAMASSTDENKTRTGTAMAGGSRDYPSAVSRDAAPSNEGAISSAPHVQQPQQTWQQPQSPAAAAEGNPEQQAHHAEVRPASERKLPASPMVTPPVTHEYILPHKANKATRSSSSGGRGVPHIYHDYSQLPDQPPESFFRKKTGGVTQAFPEKLYEMLEAETALQQNVVAWLPHGRAFIVRKPKDFTQTIMPKYFKQTKLTSFQRQLNLYGFRRITQGPDGGAYYNEKFLRGRPALCLTMKRQKIKGTGHKQPADINTEPNFYAMPAIVPSVHPATAFLQSPSAAAAYPYAAMALTNHAAAAAQAGGSGMVPSLPLAAVVGGANGAVSIGGTSTQQVNLPFQSTVIAAPLPLQATTYPVAAAGGPLANAKAEDSKPVPNSPGMRAVHSAAHLLLLACSKDRQPEGSGAQTGTTTKDRRKVVAASSLHGFGAVPGVPAPWETTTTATVQSPATTLTNGNITATVTTASATNNKPPSASSVNAQSATAPAHDTTASGSSSKKDETAAGDVGDTVEI